MKKTILLALSLFCFLNYGFTQQTQHDKTYVLYVKGQIGRGKDLCNSHGLQDIVVTLASGRKETIFTSAPYDRYSNRVFETTPFIFSYVNRPVSISFRSRARKKKRFNQGCERLIREGLTTYDIGSYDNYFRRIVNSEGGNVWKNTLFPKHGDDSNNWAEIRITPNHLWTSR